MALATSTIVALAAAAAAAGMSAYNTNQTTKRLDGEAAGAINRQGRIQDKADARVNEEVEKLATSRSSDERAKAQGSYMDALRKNRGAINAGLSSTVGGDRFQADQAGAREAVASEAADTAGLMARVDAPGMQRQGEATSFGHLGSDISLIQRESSGQDFIDQIRMRAIRRNPWIDAGASFLSSYAGGQMGGGASMAKVGTKGPNNKGGF